jgi:hypothetical protein
VGEPQQRLLSTQDARSLGVSGDFLPLDFSSVKPYIDTGGEFDSALA